MSMQQFKDSTSQGVYGTTATQAKEKNICVDCKKHVNDENLRNHLEIREYQITGLCGICFDKIFEEE